MAEDSRTPDPSTESAPHDHGREDGTPTKRPRRRAGAPTGAPVASGDATAEAPHAPRTSVPEQDARVEETPTARPATRRRAGAPAGPPSAPVFSAAEPATRTRRKDEPGKSEASEEETSGEATSPRTDAPTLADDLQALRSTRSTPAAERSDEERERRERAQLDFSSLLFQAPTTRAGAASDEDATDEDPESAEDESADDETAPGEAQETDDSQDSEGAERESGEGSGSSRRRRRRGGRGRRGRGRSEDDDSPREHDADSSDDEDKSAEGTSGDSETPDEEESAERSPSRSRRSRSRRSGRARDEAASDDHADEASSEGDADGDTGSEEDDGEEGGGSSSRRRRRRRRSGSGSSEERPSPDDPPNTVVKVRDRRDEVKAVKGSTRLEAKKQRRREGRESGRRRNVITEAEFLARRESVKRSMIVRERPGRTQIAVLEDDVLVEHYVAQKAHTSMVGNVYLGKVQNVLPSMEAAFVDIGKGRNAVLYAGEVNWDAAGLEGQPRRIELALKSGDAVLVQVTKDPIGHKGARLTSQVSLPGRYVVLVPGGSMTGISRKLPDAERSRLKKIMKQVIPEDAGVIVRTAAEGASEEELTRDVERLRAQWEKIQKAQKKKSAPVSLSQEPDLAIKVVRDVFNEDFTSLIVEGDKVYDEVHEYVSSVAPDLLERVTRHVGEKDAFAKHRVDEQLLKAMDRKVYLPSGGSLVIDRTEAMTVVDVNTGKFTGSGGSLEETVTRNNLEAAEEIVRQLRLRDIGGIIVIDFIDMVLEANRDLVLRRLVECLGRDRTKHQVAEVTSLGLVQMTRKRVGQGLVETFSTTCEHCNGRGAVVDIDGKQPVEPEPKDEGTRSSRRRGGKKNGGGSAQDAVSELVEQQNGADVHRLEEDERSRELARATIASIAAASGGASHPEVTVDGQVISVDDEAPEGTAGSADHAASEEADSATVPAPEDASTPEEPSEDPVPDTAERADEHDTVQAAERVEPVGDALLSPQDAPEGSGSGEAEENASED